ncbi:MAG: hypothetical protein DRJ31_08620 [Candidatus Methanomethylicota archaeon]|uniref:DUF3786 domain-containing protein n=1 Tax=Thermoproteota archaeon TaxID=2056631 RepID=A0A497EMU7_9CREN|nr:MAG: hypothetical protein DRJ31_08620 [Candidatus Verstraetearchaeota archaeon]
MASRRGLIQPTEADCRKLLQELLKMDEAKIAKRCGVIFLAPPKPGRRKGRFVVNLLTKTYSVELDTGEVIDLIAGKAASCETAFIILRYLSSSGSVGRKEDWTSIEEFPKGKLYRNYFERYVIRPFTRLFGYDSEKYELVCRRLGGKKERLGGLSYSFNFLPKVRILTQLWVGKREEYISPKANLMFNYAARHFLSTEDLLLAGRIMVSMMNSEAKKI